MQRVSIRIRIRIRIQLRNPSVCFILAIHTSSHLVLLILEWNAEVLAGVDHGLHGRQDVLVDQSGEALLILICVTRAVDYSHLLDEGALATLSRTLVEGGGVKTPEIRQIGEEEDRKRKRKLNLTLHLNSSNMKLCVTSVKQRTNHQFSSKPHPLWTHISAGITCPLWPRLPD